MALIKGLPWLDRELRMRNAIVRAWFFICIAMICREIQIAWNRGKPHNCLSNVFARKCEGLCNTRRSNMICHKESFPERTSWALINSINSFLFMAWKDCLMLYRVWIILRSEHLSWKATMELCSFGYLQTEFHYHPIWVTILRNFVVPHH